MCNCDKFKIERVRIAAKAYSIYNNIKVAIYQNNLGYNFCSYDHAILNNIEIKEYYPNEEI